MNTQHKTIHAPQPEVTDVKNLTTKSYAEAAARLAEFKRKLAAFKLLGFIMMVVVGLVPTILVGILAWAAASRGLWGAMAVTFLFGMILFYSSMSMSCSDEEPHAKESKFCDRLFGPGFYAKVCAWEKREAETQRENRMKKEAREKQERKNLENLEKQAVAELEADLRVTEQKPIGGSPFCEGRVGLSA